MEKNEIKTFTCLIHKKSIINKICTKMACDINPLCCIDCVLDDNCSHLPHKQFLLSIEEYIDYIDQEYKNTARVQLGNQGPPGNLLNYITRQDECFQNLSRHIEEQKRLVEKTLTEMQVKFTEICAKAKATAFQLLDHQFNNLKANHDLYKLKLKKYYENNKNANLTKVDIIQRFNGAKDASELIKYIHEIQGDLLDSFPKDRNLLNENIEEIKTKLNLLGKAIKTQQIIKPTLQFTTKNNQDSIIIDSFSKNLFRLLNNEFKLEFPISRITYGVEINSNILTFKDEKLLNEWINPDLKGKFKLLYRATRDGFYEDVFLQKVGSCKPTVIIIHSNDKRFDGNIDVNWNGGNQFQHSSNTFLFSLNGQAKYRTLSEKAKYAILIDKINNNDEIFGFGYFDIPTSNRSLMLNQSYSSFPCSYYPVRRNSYNLPGSRKFTAFEIEAFQLISRR